MGELIITIKRHIYIITFLRSDPRPDILFLTFFLAFSGIFPDILSGILSGILSDIYSITFYLASDIYSDILSGILSAICLVSSVMCSGPGVPSCIQSWRRRRRWEGGGGGGGWRSCTFEKKPEILTWQVGKNQVVESFAITKPLNMIWLSYIKFPTNLLYIIIWYVKSYFIIYK